jgi:hypothetical protein
MCTQGKVHVISDEIPETYDGNGTSAVRRLGKACSRDFNGCHKMSKNANSDAFLFPPFLDVLDSLRPLLWRALFLELPFLPIPCIVFIFFLTAHGPTRPLAMYKRTFSAYMS